MFMLLIRSLTPSTNFQVVCVKCKEYRHHFTKLSEIFLSFGTQEQDIPEYEMWCEDWGFGSIFDK